MNEGDTAVGIARLDDIAYLYIEKDTMTEQIGFADDLCGYSVSMAL